MLTLKVMSQQNSCSSLFPCLVCAVPVSALFYREDTVAQVVEFLLTAMVRLIDSRVYQEPQFIVKGIGHGLKFLYHYSGDGLFYLVKCLQICHKNSVRMS